MITLVLTEDEANAVHEVLLDKMSRMTPEKDDDSFVYDMLDSAAEKIQLAVSDELNRDDAHAEAWSMDDDHSIADMEDVYGC